MDGSWLHVYWFNLIHEKNNVWDSEMFYNEEWYLISWFQIYKKWLGPQLKIGRVDYNNTLHVWSSNNYLQYYYFKSYFVMMFATFNSSSLFFFVGVFIIFYQAWMQTIVSRLK